MALRAVELINRAVANHAIFKTVAEELERLPPDSAAVEALLTLFHQGSAPAWFTAHLLGCIGHDSGYDLTREILIAAPGMLAESYAGVALAKIRGESALNDLVTLMREAPKKSSREGAAYGIARLRCSAAIPAVLQAMRDRLIRPSTAASILADLPIAEGEVVALVGSQSLREVRVGTEIVWWRIAGRVDGRPRWTESETARIAGAVKAALDHSEVTMAPRKRHELSEWVGHQMKEPA